MMGGKSSPTQQVFSSEVSGRCLKYLIHLICCLFEFHKAEHRKASYPRMLQRDEKVYFFRETKVIIIKGNQAGLSKDLEIARGRAETFDSGCGNKITSDFLPN